MIFVSISLFLMSCQKQITPYDQAREAIVTDDVPTLSKLLTDHPAIVYDRDSFDQATLLHQACSYGYYPDKVKVIHLLVKAGSDVNAKDDLGRTPAHRICYYGQDGERLLPYFAKHGADLTIIDSYGKKAGDYCKNKGTKNSVTH